MTKFFSAFFAAVLLMAAFSIARAGVLGADTGESYADPIYKELSQTLVMMDGIDVSNPIVANEYAKMFYCDLYKQNSRNDFDWQKIRHQIMTRVLQKKEYYRIQYQIPATVKLNVYNFETQDFPFTPETALVRVGSIELLGIIGLSDPTKKVFKLCGSFDWSPVFPINHIVMMNQSLTFDRLKIPMDEAKVLLEKMTAMRNKDRLLFVRMRFRLQALNRKLPPPPLNLRRSRAEYLSEVTQIDVFLDEAMTKFITTIHIK